MTPEQQQLVISHAQQVARFYLALRCSGEKLSELVAHSIGANSPTPDAINLFLRKEKIRRLLASDFETALWISTDANKSWRLVCLAPPATVEDAIKRLNSKPPGSDCCNYCWQSESGYRKEDLLLELDIYGKETGARLHPHGCDTAWSLMRRMVERAAILEKTT